MLVSKEYKKQIVNYYVSLFKKLNLSDKTFGFFLRAFHVNLPIYCDVIRFSSIKNEELRSHIHRAGVELPLS